MSQPAEKLQLLKHRGSLGGSSHSSHRAGTYMNYTAVYSKPKLVILSKMVQMYGNTYAHVQIFSHPLLTKCQLVNYFLTEITEKKDDSTLLPYKYCLVFVFLVWFCFQSEESLKSSQFKVAHKFINMLHYFQIVKYLILCGIARYLLYIIVLINVH